MNPTEIADGYDQLARHWHSKDFPRDNGIAQHQRALQFVTSPGAALDIGCGSSGRLIDLLLEAGFTVEGIDLSPKMLELAKQRHPQVQFHHADIRHWQFSQHYSFITAWDSIWHLPMQDHAATLARILDALAPGGIMIFSFGGLLQPSEKQDNSMGPEMYYSTLGINQTLATVASADCCCMHLEFDQYPEPHAYLIAQRSR